MKKENQQMKNMDLLPDDEAVIRTYTNMVYRLAFSRTQCRDDADDIYQEVFLRYIRKHPVFSCEEQRKAWLLRVTINCAKKFHLSFWQRKTGPLEEDIVFETKENEELYMELRRLPEHYRMVLHLFYYEELSVEEISQLTNTKPSTVRTQLTRARRRLRTIMEEEKYV